MYLPSNLRFLLVTSSFLLSQSFNVGHNGVTQTFTAKTRHLNKLFSSTASGDNTNANNSGGDNGEYERPTLVDQQVFENAVKSIIPPKEDENPNVGYAIARTTATLPVPPGIDLVETEFLCLISGTSQAAIDAGVQCLDTIVRVTSFDGEFDENIMGTDIEDQYEVISAAIGRAKVKGDDGFNVELNRLLKGYYGQAETQQS